MLFFGSGKAADSLPNEKWLFADSRDTLHKES